MLSNTSPGRACLPGPVGERSYRSASHQPLANERGEEVGGTLVRWQPGFPSDFPPPDAKPCGTGTNRRGRQVTAEAVDRPFVHVTSDIRDQKGMGRDSRGEGDATCKIAGIAYTGSNPVPATLPLICGNAAAA